MAEEHHIEDFAGSDNLTMMRRVLETVKGSSPVSQIPVLDDIQLDDHQYAEQFEFE